MYTQFEAICNRLFSFWGQKLSVDKYICTIWHRARAGVTVLTTGFQSGDGVQTMMFTKCVCVKERERLQHHLNSVRLWNRSLLLLELCSPEVMGCFNHQSYNLLLTRGGTPGGWDPGKVRARMPLLGFPFSLGQSLMEWADKTVLCRCPLLLWLPSEEAESPHYTSPLWTQIDFCWINKGTALWQFIVCNELLK